jgi:tripartite-type tricarboxylate transporter receptor subunit TctC
MLAPKGTPKAVVDRLHAAYEKALADPEIRRRIVEVGAEPATSTPAELGRSWRRSQEVGRDHQGARHQAELS